jgi:NTF2 fold immunity protein
VGISWLFRRKRHQQSHLGVLPTLPYKQDVGSSTLKKEQIMSRLIGALALVMIFVLGCSATGTAPDSDKLPARGIVPDEITAVKIAEVVFEPIFGQERVNKFLPYHARLDDGIWNVYGTLKSGSRGGTPELLIQKLDGKVIKVWHSQ